MNVNRTDIVLLEGARTPFVNISGSFRDVTATELGVHAAKEAVKKRTFNLKRLITLFLEMFNSPLRMLIC